MNHLQKYAGLKAVEWRDLTKLAPWRVVTEVLLPVPFLAMVLWFTERGELFLVLMAAFFSF